MTAGTGRHNKFFYAFGSVGSGVYSAFNTAILSLYVSAFTSNPYLLGYLSNTQTIEGAVLQPLVGRWSDRMTSPLGRRRPFLLVCVPISLFFLALIPVMAHQSHNLALPLIALSIILFSITWNMASDPATALLVDITTPEERPVYNSILVIIGLLGQVGILVYTTFAALKKNDIPEAVFYVCVVLLFLTYGLVFFGVREPTEARSVAQLEDKIPLRVYIRELRSFKEAFKLLASMFFLWTGLHAFIPFITIFPTKVVGASKSQAIVVFIVLILTSAALSYPAGRLGARYGNRRWIILGTLTLIGAALLGLAVPSYTWMFPLAMLAGTGFAFTNVLTYPLLAQLIPGSKVGVFTGIQTAFGAAAVPVSVLINGTLISHFGFRSMFALLAVMMVLDVLILLTIHESVAEKQVREVEAQERAVAAGLTPAAAV